MRDQIKSEIYFLNYIEHQKTAIDKFTLWIDSGKTPVQRIGNVRGSIAEKSIGILLAEYSIGSDITKLSDTWNYAVNLMEQGWLDRWKLRDSRGNVLDQYILSAYDEMLWMISLGYLLGVNKGDFLKLVELIDRDQVKDYLFEFIIRAKIKDRLLLAEESYKDHLGIPSIFSKLRTAAAELGKAKAEQLVKEFITKDWYVNHKDAGWYNSHKIENNAYFGYWSFETAAVVKIMGLDDSSFRDCQYYPKDLL